MYEANTAPPNMNIPTVMIVIVANQSLRGSSQTLIIASCLPESRDNPRHDGPSTISGRPLESQLISQQLVEHREDEPEDGDLTQRDTELMNHERPAQLLHTPRLPRLLRIVKPSTRGGF